MKKITIILILVVFLCNLVSCTSYEDTNGLDDYSLQTLTDADFFKPTSYSQVGSFTTTVNNKTKISIKKFNGIREFEEIEDAIGIKITVKVNSGNFKLVLIDDDQIIDVIENNVDEQYYVINDDEISLMGAGESANIELIYTVVYDD